jgi:hypothetical protein
VEKAICWIKNTPKGRFDPNRSKERKSLQGSSVRSFGTYHCPSTTLDGKPNKAIPSYLYRGKSFVGGYLR